MKANADLQKMARESLQGKWGLAVAATLLYLLISAASSWMPHVGWAVSIILSGPLTLGLTVLFLRVARGGPTDIMSLFEGFNRFGAALVAYLLMTIYILLWSLLLIVPGIVAAMGYGLTWFILADGQDLSGPEAIRRSKEYMRGKRWKLFCLFLRFLGWAVLSVLTLGIGFLWLIPYVQTSLAHFYEDARPRAAEAPPAPVQAPGPLQAPEAPTPTLPS